MKIKQLAPGIGASMINGTSSILALLQAESGARSEPGTEVQAASPLPTSEAAGAEPCPPFLTIGVSNIKTSARNAARKGGRVGAYSCTGCVPRFACCGPSTAAALYCARSTLRHTRLRPCDAFDRLQRRRPLSAVLMSQKRYSLIRQGCTCAHCMCSAEIPSSVSRCRC